MPDDTTTPVAAEGLRERLTEAARRWALMNPIAAWYGDGPRAEKLAKIWGRQIADAVMAELVGDPGNLPGQIEAALRSTWDGTPTHMDDAIRAEVKAVMPVFIEHTVQLAAENAQLRAERDHAVGELSARRDHETRWETEKARADKAERERDESRARWYAAHEQATRELSEAREQVAALREELASRDLLLEKYRETVSVILGQREKATALLRDLVDTDDCWFDHHGGCQAHGYLSLEPGERCPQAEAKELLRERGEALPARPGVPEEIRRLAEAPAEPDIRMKTIDLTNGRDSYQGVSARGASRKNGSSQIFKKHGWYWLNSIQGYVCKDGPAAVAETVRALRDAGLTVEAPEEIRRLAQATTEEKTDES